MAKLYFTPSLKKENKNKMKGVKFSSNSNQTIIFLLILVSTFCLSIEVALGQLNKATLTLNSFEKGGDGGAASECDNKFHSDDTLIVALSTVYFNHKERCFKEITIFGNGRSVNAMVVDECKCGNNIVDGSSAVWKALGVPEKEGEMDIFWGDA